MDDGSTHDKKIFQYPSAIKIYAQAKLKNVKSQSPLILLKLPAHF